MGWKPRRSQPVLASQFRGRSKRRSRRNLVTTVSTPKAESPATKESPNVSQALVALVGKRDEPTDALRDYCAWLGQALGRRSIAMETVEVLWDGKGWLRALAKLWKQSGEWRGRWVVLQYTA